MQIVDGMRMELADAIGHALQSACEAGAMAAILDGYRGGVWAIVAPAPTGIQIHVTRDEATFTKYVQLFGGINGALRCHVIDVNEEVAQMFLAQMQASARKAGGAQAGGPAS